MFMEESCLTGSSRVKVPLGWRVRVASRVVSTALSLSPAASFWGLGGYYGVAFVCSILMMIGMNPPQSPYASTDDCDLEGYERYKD